eukprot:6206118-Pleurochrysis_carterae.AAC.3
MSGSKSLVALSKRSCAPLGVAFDNKDLDVAQVDRLRVDEVDLDRVAVERVFARAHVVVDETEVLEVPRVEPDVVRLGREQTAAGARRTAVRGDVPGNKVIRGGRGDGAP